MYVLPIKKYSVATSVLRSAVNQAEKLRCYHIFQEK